ncbi:peptide ABC transporter substrate-binding protein [Clostridium gasigenes]|uniref:peptide ABC transporter substrate-binding protein n=1 Tax=Clostridium gasigenes TaxID=94869 RepID=UPI001C0B98B5|nr:peptide ABC transporter substrate-binding protein [Clostridium gasigenes]MBU3131439.1 peptide ABC transporter substrate-binding protein [Clostridium gasigenes]MBU3134940.1 peptide ABC transporter substrate-binding protein [Clostridium gasigenes]
MKSSKMKKLCALALSLVLGTSVLAGCGGKDSSASKQQVIYNLGTDPKTLDPQLNTASEAGNIILNAFEGLTRMDKDSKAAPGVAEKWDVSPDGLKYTFHLRKDSKWSDGKDVTANDFKYAWLRALDPKTAADYSYQLYYIKGGEEFNSNKGTAEQVGIKVVDDYTLEVELKAPTSYFTQLTAFATYMPVRKDIIEANGDAWATKPESYISNGPFKMTDFRMKDAIVLVKNENYWDASNVKLDKLDIRMVTESTTSYAEFKAGTFDMINEVPPAEVENALKDKDATVAKEFGTYFMCLNVGNNTDALNAEAVKALGNKKFRQALSVAIDRTALVENVTKGHQVPAMGFTAPGAPTPDGKDFAESKKYIEPTGNIEEAKKLLAEAGYPNGEGLPTFNFLINSEGAHSAVAQYLQSAWKEIGVKTEISSQEFKVFLQTRQQGQYMIGRHGWNGDYVDPLTFLDMWVTGGGNNEAGYSNVKYDALIEEAKTTPDEAKKYEALRSAEDILMDEMPVIPLYYYTKVRAIKDDIKDLIISPIGKVDFKNAYRG